MKNFANSKSFKFGTALGYLYSVIMVSLIIVSFIVFCGLNKANLHYLFALIFFGICCSAFILVSSLIGLILFLSDTFRHDIPEKINADNSSSSGLNLISFIIFIGISTSVWLGCIVIMPILCIIPVIILSIYFLLKLIRKNENV